MANRRHTPTQSSFLSKQGLNIVPRRGKTPKRRPLDYVCTTDDTDTTTSYDGPVYTTQTPLGTMGNTTKETVTPQRPTEVRDEDKRAQQKEGTTVSSAATLDIDDAAMVGLMADVPDTGTPAATDQRDDHTSLNVSHNTGVTASTNDTTNDAVPPPTGLRAFAKSFKSRASTKGSLDTLKKERKNVMARLVVAQHHVASDSDLIRENFVPTWLRTDTAYDPMMKNETDVLKQCSTIRNTYYRDILLALKAHHSEISRSLQERFIQLDESLITFLEGSGLPDIENAYVDIVEEEEASRLKLEDEFTKKRIKTIRYLRYSEGAPGPPNKRYKPEGNDNHDLTLSQLFETPVPSLREQKQQKDQETRKTRHQRYRRLRLRRKRHRTLISSNSDTGCNTHINHYTSLNTSITENSVFSFHDDSHDTSVSHDEHVDNTTVDGTASDADRDETVDADDTVRDEADTEQTPHATAQRADAP